MVVFLKKRRQSSVFKIKFHFMKQDYGMFYFFPFFCLPRPPLFLNQNMPFSRTRISLILTAWTFKWQLFWRQILVRRINIQFLVAFIYYASHHEAVLSCFASVPADPFIFILFVPPQTGFSITT